MLPEEAVAEEPESDCEREVDAVLWGSEASVPVDPVSFGSDVSESEDADEAEDASVVTRSGVEVSESSVVIMVVVVVVVVRSGSGMVSGSFLAA